MRWEAIGKLLGSNKKAVAINTILIANAFIWYSYAFNFLLSAIHSLGLDQPIASNRYIALYRVISRLINRRICKPQGQKTIQFSSFLDPCRRFSLTHAANRRFFTKLFGYNNIFRHLRSQLWIWNPNLLKLFCIHD